MLSRRSFIQSTAAFGAMAATGLARSLPSRAVSIWESPLSIDHTGQQNVSAALTDWLATTGQPGDVFRLRRGSGFAPGVYWIPQGVRIGKPMTLDLRGCWLYTGTVLGAEDPNLEQSKVLYPPLWNDGGEQTDVGVWPKRRVCVVINASDVRVESSLVSARIQGAARTVHFRGGFTQLSAGCQYNSAYEGQHAFRIGGKPGATVVPVEDVVIDLTNIAAEFVHGDGVYLNDNNRRITILGRHLGEAFMGGTPSGIDDKYLEGHSGQGGTITDGKWVPDTLPPPGIHHTGRHGIATDFRNYDLLVDGVGIWRTGRACIDLEPASTSAEIVRPVIRNMETGIHTLNWLPAAGPRPIKDLQLLDNVCYEMISMDTRNTGATHRHSNWQIINNRCLGGVKKRTGAVFEVDRIDGLEIRDNFAMVRGTAQGVNEGTSTGVIIDPAENVQFPFTP
jgi:hypothetical protein